mgnify:CR=1 FL=1
MSTNSDDNKRVKIRNYTKMDELSQAISRGLSLQNRRMGYEESMAAAEHLINFFGYSDRVIDNMLEPEDRVANTLLDFKHLQDHISSKHAVKLCGF